MEELITLNLKLVHSIARKYMPQVQDNATSYDDIYSEGCIGLIKAAERFDPTQGYTFSTYAYPMISGYIRTFLARKTNTIRFPSNAVLLANKIYNADLMELSPESIANQVGCTEEAAEQALQYLRSNCRSLDAPVLDSDNGEVSLSSLVPSIDDFSKVEVQEFLETLKPAFREIVEQLMQGYNTREIGRLKGITRSAIWAKLQVIKEKYTAFQENKLNRRCTW